MLVFLLVRAKIIKGGNMSIYRDQHLYRYGNWGICYTYGTWFGVGALAACGRNYQNCPALRKACEFLLSKQLPNGGWGESYLSSHNKVFVIFFQKEYEK